MKVRIFTPSLGCIPLALTLAACGEGGGGSAGVSVGETASGVTAAGSAGDSASSVDSDGGTGAAEPTGGGSDSQGETQGTTGQLSATDAATTSTAVCGDEIVEGPEQCDDGNEVGGDGCEADCTVTPPVCGNGTSEQPEACDDGNQNPGDGCEPDCTLTPAECGNGVVDAGEQCDDGNDIDGGRNDFCRNDCTQFIPPQCQAPATYEVCDGAPDVITDKDDKTNALRAIGICDLEPSNSVITTAFEFDPSARNDTWQVAKGFGTYKVDHDNDPNTPEKLLYSPREGDTFLMLSSGVIAAPDPQTGIVIEGVDSQQDNDDNFNSDSDTLPAPFKVVNGSNDGAGGTPFMNCDNGASDNDCSDTLQNQWHAGKKNPNDRIYFTFETTVPDGTFGYSFDFVFCSSEWPTFVNTGFNDLLIAYQVDPTPDDPNGNPPVDPYSGNVAFIPHPNNMMEGLPITITALDPYFDGPGFTFDEPQLAGTGFEQHACSDWFTAKGGVQPGAHITVGFFLADMSDSILATVALLDNFRWDCQGCTPNEVTECGVKPM